MVQSEHGTKFLAGLQVGLKTVCKFPIFAHEKLHIMSFSTYVDRLEIEVQPLEGAIRIRRLPQVGLGSAEFW